MPDPLKKISLIAWLLVSGCGLPLMPSTESPPPATPPVVTTHPVEPQPVIETAPRNPQELSRVAAEYLERAREAPPSERGELILSAAALLLEAGQPGAAKRVLKDIDPAAMTVQSRWRMHLLGAEIALRENRSADAMRALSALQGLNTPALQARKFGLLAQASLALGNRLTAVQALVDRGRWLESEQQTLKNQQQIWRVLETIPAAQIQQGRAATSDAVTAGWFDLALISDRYGADAYHYDAQLRDWRHRYPQHPASPTFLATLAPALIGPQRTADVRRIALLLPLASRYGRAAQAVHDGFLAMHAADPASIKPDVVVYDIGGEASLAPAYYRLAINEGADFVVGPLGKEAAGAVASSEPARVPILLLGTIPDTAFPDADVYQFDLSPEQEAKEAAQRAYLDGHRVAAVLHPDSDWGRRVQTAFRNGWEQLGGVIVNTQPYHAGDPSLAVKRLLNVDRSEARKDILAGRLGVPLKFQARRRQDIDCIFLAGGAAQARLVKPQINYFRAHDIPVYATSHVYAAQPDPVNDADLNGIVFGDMPWLLLNEGAAVARRSAFPPHTAAYRNTPLDRLYALGMDAYTIIPSLAYLRRNPIAEISGATARLHVSSDGHINRRLTWARFEEGVPVVQDAILEERRFDAQRPGITPTLETRRVGGT